MINFPSLSPLISNLSYVAFSLAFKSFSNEFGFGVSSSFLLIRIEDSVSADRGGDSVGQELDKEVNDEDSEADKDGNDPLLPMETIRADFEHNTSEGSDNNLESEDTDPDNEEDRILADSCEGVKFVMNFARAEHVNDLEHDECGEEESPVAGRASRVVALFGFATNRLPLSSKFNAAFLDSRVESWHFQFAELLVDLSD